jgi:sodium-dependent phosphate cotransporter
MWLMTSALFDRGKFSRSPSLVLNLVIMFALLYIFLVGIDCLSSGIKANFKGVMDQYFSPDMNPVLALLVGILATTLVQSSSVTTALIVGLVGSGEVAVAAAVPMIMGANIGTTVTNSIASLAHASRDVEFRRAFSAATCHDFFNLLSVALLLPVELITRAIFGKGLLEGLSATIAEWTVGASGANYDSPIKAAFKAGRTVIQNAIEWIGLDGRVGNTALIIVGGLVILTSLTLIVKVMRGVVVRRLERYVNRFLGTGGPMAFVVGMLLTVMVQSSSITTSTLVPLAGAGLLTLQQIYPITLGANIGTTVTALLASMAIDGDTATAARQIALVHLLFNLMGILVWYVPKPVREIPLKMALWLADLATQSKRWAVGYVFGVFYILPAGIFFLSTLF